MRNPWLIRLLGSGTDPQQRVLPTKSAAIHACREWVAAETSRRAVIQSRQHRRVVMTLNNLNGAVLERHRVRDAKPSPAEADPKSSSDSGAVRAALNQLGFSKAAAGRIAATVAEVFRNSLRNDGRAWTPLGDMVVQLRPRVQRARNRFHLLEV